MKVCDHSPKARHSGVWSQVSLRKHHYEQSSGGDGIPDELFQILKDATIKVVYSIGQQIGKRSSGHRIGKGQFSFQSQRRSMPKNVQTTTQLHSSHTLVK